MLSCVGDTVDGGQPADTAPVILVVEDERAIADFLRRALEHEGFAVRTVFDGLEGERLALSGEYDMVLLDLMLPGRDGLEILATLRASRPALPVIVLTARGEIDERVAGLDAGAVDYLVKPFSLAELIARVRAALRVAAQVSSSNVLRAGDIEIDLLSRRVRRAGEPVALSATEFDLLALLLRHSGQVLSRTQILAAVWRYEHDPATNVVDVYIGYLRRKLRRADSPAPIHTVRAVGYRLGDAA